MASLSELLVSYPELTEELFRESRRPFEVYDASVRPVEPAIRCEYKFGTG